MDVLENSRHKGNALSAQTLGEVNLSPKSRRAIKFLAEIHM